MLDKFDPHEIDPDATYCEESRMVATAGPLTVLEVIIMFALMFFMSIIVGMFIGFGTGFMRWLTWMAIYLILRRLIVATKIPPTKLLHSFLTRYQRIYRAVPSHASNLRERQHNYLKRDTKLSCLKFWE
ncbi:hypothetical protein [Aliagarivorans taiwanensis]|uniref:hypothetical protein n=1 Tax=Aliagarivorans taiwanensis TaxID=561966 RepID=UPI000479200F|nr:hypothetical protein [Aliagarivorans taiwanensis]